MATSYSNPGATGYRLGEIDGSFSVTTGALQGYFPSLLGAKNDNGGTTALNGITDADSTKFPTGNVPTGFTMTFDWGADARVIIDAVKWYQNVNTSHGTYVLEGGDATLSGWTQIGSSFTLGGTFTASNYTEYTFTNSTGYRAYRIRQTGGTNSATPRHQGIEFKIEEATVGGITARPSAFNLDGGLPDQTTSRTGDVTTTTDVTTSDGVVANLMNAGVGNNTTDSWKWNSLGFPKFVKFDFGTARTINGFCWRNTGTANHGTWKLAGSNDDSSYTDLVTGVTFTNCHNFAFFANTTPYRYYKLISTAGSTSSTSRQAEMYFRIKNPAPAAGSQPVLVTAISG